MKTLKGWLTGGALAAILLFGAGMAKADAGIIFGATGDGTGGTTDNPACDSGNGGIIFGDANGGIIFGAAGTGIIFGATGIIFGDTGTDDTGGCPAGNSYGGLLISD